VNAPGSLSGWPRNATKEMLSLLNNAEATAKGKDGLDNPEDLIVSSVVCNMAQKGRRRTYRAHGRIGPYMSTPSHVNLILKKKTKTVKKAPVTQASQRTVKLAARYGDKNAKRVAVGGAE
jgi:large subunit ribosomal protein L17e